MRRMTLIIRSSERLIIVAPMVLGFGLAVGVVNLESTFVEDWSVCRARLFVHCV